MSRASRVALVALAVTLVLAPLLTLHPAVTHLYEAGFANLSVEASHPQVIVFLALTAASALPAAGFLLSLAAATRSREELRSLIEGSEPACLGGIHYRIFSSDVVVMFTAGPFRPIVFVSSEAVRTLSSPELHAALLHERAHQRNGDVLWGLLLRAVGKAFAFLPQTSRMVQMAALRAECEADEYAIRGGARRSDLFEAIAAASPPPAKPVSAAISDANVELRLVRLVHPGTPLPGHPTRGFLALAATVVVPAVLAHVVAIVAAVCTTSFAS
ncbi:M56 family metallopeptidase [bacterium]|nr:M56 family metallopeptidase [bacterium]